MKDHADKQTQDLSLKGRHGGVRVGSGRKAQQGPTVVKRIPESYAELVDQLLNHLKEIDLVDSVTHSKTIRFNSRVTGEDLQLIVSGIDQDQRSAETATAIPEPMAPKVKKSGKYQWITPSGVFLTCKEAAGALGRPRKTVSDWFNDPSNTEFTKVKIEAVSAEKSEEL